MICKKHGNEIPCIDCIMEQIFVDVPIGRPYSLPQGINKRFFMHLFRKLQKDLALSGSQIVLNELGVKQMRHKMSHMTYYDISDGMRLGQIHDTTTKTVSNFARRRQLGCINPSAIEDAECNKNRHHSLLSAASIRSVRRGRIARSKN